MHIAFAHVAVFLAVAVVFVVAALIFGWLVRPNNSTEVKRSTYECGELPVGRAWFNFNPRFYIIGLIFLIFDVEIVFMFPVAAVFREWIGVGWGAIALVEVLLFVAVLLVAFLYVWAKGDLDWVRRVEREDPLH